MPPCALIINAKKLATCKGSNESSSTATCCKMWKRQPAKPVAAVDNHNIYVVLLDRHACRVPAGSQMAYLSNDEGWRSSRKALSNAPIQDMIPCMTNRSCTYKHTAASHGWHLPDVTEQDDHLTACGIQLPLLIIVHHQQHSADRHSPTMVAPKSPVTADCFILSRLRPFSLWEKASPAALQKTSAECHGFVEPQSSAWWATWST